MLNKEAECINEHSHLVDIFYLSNYTFNVIKLCVTSSNILSTSSFKTVTSITSLSPFSPPGSMPHNLLWIQKRPFPAKIKASWTTWFDLCMYLMANCVYNPVLCSYHDLITGLLSRSGLLNAHSLWIFILISFAPKLCVVGNIRWRLDSWLYRLLWGLQQSLNLWSVSVLIHKVRINIDTLPSCLWSLMISEELVKPLTQSQAQSKPTRSR